MSNPRGILYGALHKFYSALSSLEKFEKGKNFFDNISYLDNFFSEYRNITFVLQNSVANTQYKTTYEELRDKYLIGDVCRWFVDKRNEVLKQQPFDLEKKIVINIYSEQGTIELPEAIYTIDNDVEFSTIIDSLKKMLLDLNQIEVMFSAEFTFYERGHTKDLYENFISGIHQMKLFLKAMKEIVKEDCKLSDELEKKIESLKFYGVPKNMLFIDDYLFYCKRNYFEKASRVELWAGPYVFKAPIENLNKTYPGNDLFQKFEVMHLVMYQMQKTLLPTCLLLFKDDTFQLLTFGGTLKTTFFRKFHEVAKRINTEEIISVLFVTEMYAYGQNNIHGLNSQERIKHAQKEFLSFYIVDKDLTKKHRKYDTDKINDFEYVASVMHKTEDQFKLPSFYNPVVNEFTRKLQNSTVGIG